jgi:hypothetical protein
VESNVHSPSTTSAWKWAKVRRRPQGMSTVRRSRSAWHHLAAWPRRERLTLVVKWRGGAEAWWLVQARGSSGVFPGYLALDDVLSIVMNEKDRTID